VDAIADTSIVIRDALLKDYHVRSDVFLPPCVSVERFHPRRIGKNHEIWSFLSKLSGLSVPEIQRFKIITEISRTDTTKRKNVLIDAFSRVHRDNPDTFLIVAIDENEESLASTLKSQIEAAGIASHTAAIGNEWNRLPDIYAVTDVYCTPSIMEGFGMSAQEAAATRVPVVSSSLVPYVTEYLLGVDAEKISYRSDTGSRRLLERGVGAIVVQPDDAAGFALALEMLIENDALRIRMGKVAYSITIPYFTWDAMVDIFLKAITAEIDGEPPRDTKKLRLAV
jgi:glycosyltransferase involved in cell wall biosynthesis